jgi:SnoaL-like domain
MEPAEVARRIFDAYRAGDLAGIQGVVSPDITLHMPGRNSLAGDYTGMGEVMALVARAAGYFAPGSVRVLGVDVNEGLVDARVEVSAGFMASRLGPVQLTQRMRLDEDARVVESWIVPDEPEEWDEFVGTVFDHRDDA